MVTLEDVKDNEEVKALIECTRNASGCARLYRAFY